jgi:PTH1 family peptidyl-tRNA hydrolase
MKLIVGLGNIGQEYQNTYHNIGFQSLDYITHNALFTMEKKFLGAIYRQGEICYLKPHTYMNQSGKSVRQIADYFDIPAEDIIIIHDDSDIALGQYKIQTNRGSGGHNGVNSVFEHISNSVHRIRIGVRSERHQGMKAENFVLKHIPLEETKVLIEVFGHIEQEIHRIFDPKIS